MTKIQELMKEQYKQRVEQFGHYIGTKDLIEEDNEESPTLIGNPIIDRDEEEMQHNWAREAHEELMEMISFNQEDR